MSTQIKLGKNTYGKNAINLSKIIRHKDHHEIRQISVNVALEGDFETAHTLGDNSKILPTDTMKNTVFALAKDHLVSSIEEFGLFLANHFLFRNPQVSQVTIELTEHAWQRLQFNGEEHPHAFIGGNSEKHITQIVHRRNNISVTSGIKDMLLLKTTDSGFENYIKDEYTTLNETSDRILSTQCQINWQYHSHQLNFADLYTAIRTTLLKTFAFHKSLSVQQTLYEMGKEILNQYEVVTEIDLIMPNKHHILYNLEQFGIENQNDIFIATDEPFGYITGTVKRE